jgi:hypothetical protein
MDGGQGPRGLHELDELVAIAVSLLGPERARHRRPKGEGLAGPVHVEDGGGGVAGNEGSESGGGGGNQRGGCGQEGGRGALT